MLVDKGNMSDDLLCFETTKLLRDQFDSDDIYVRRADSGNLVLSIKGHDQFEMPVSDDDTPLALSAYLTGAIQGFDAGFEQGFISAIGQLPKSNLQVEV